MSTADGHPRLPAGMHFIERDWLSANNVVFFDGPAFAREATIVDTGYIKHAAMTVELVRHLMQREGATRLSRIINTHLHSDHCGGNAALAHAFDAPIHVPVADADAVDRWDPKALTFEDFGQRCERFALAGALSPGDWLSLAGATWKVLAAPGHDPHSLMLYCAEHRILISADALWANGFGIVFPELEGASGFAEQQAVLELIATLDVALVIPGHGAMFTDVAPALERAFSRLRFFREDPTRNARYALKALVKYMLLDLERLPMQELHARAGATRILRDAAAQLGQPLEQALDRAVDELVAQKVIARDRDVVVNR